MVKEPTPSNESLQNGFFATMPPWAKGAVFAFTIIPVAVAISGQILGVRVGDYLDKYMEIQLQQLQSATDAGADKIISVLSEKFDALDARVAAVEAQVGSATSQIQVVGIWACEHADTQDLKVDKPVFCE